MPIYSSIWLASSHNFHTHILVELLLATKQLFWSRNKITSMPHPRKQTKEERFASTIGRRLYQSTLQVAGFRTKITENTEKKTGKKAQRSWDSRQVLVGLGWKVWQAETSNLHRNCALSIHPHARSPSRPLPKVTKNNVRHCGT